MVKRERQLWVETLNEAFPLKRIEESPCSAACPLGTNVKSYVSLIAAGRFEDALEIVRRTNPFPGICGRVCPHPCEDRCLRGEIDEPIAIAALKRFLADYELRRGVIPRNGDITLQREKVAVIGAGPAGLTCAQDLANAGFRVTVFESRPEPGGMLAYGIPPYRLPRDILRTEIAAVQALGVDLRLNTPVGVRISFEEIKSSFRAVCIATGAMKAKKMGIEGEQQVKEGLLNWVSLLHETAAGRAEKPGENVLVIGGGNTAVDCARVALRLGSKQVRLVYRRSRVQMPAYEEELEDAEAEGVYFTYLASPVRLIHKDGRLTGAEFVRMRLAGKDESGRRRPVEIPGSGFVIPCDAIIPAVGQELDSSFLGGSPLLFNRDGGLLLADPQTMATSVKGVFAGGDAVHGPGSVVEAIAAGHRAANSILNFLTDRGSFRMDGSHASKAPLSGRGSHMVRELFIPDAPPERVRRLSAPRLDRIARRRTFDEVDTGLTELRAVEEASRCIRCGPCEECSSCVGVCEKKQLLLVPSEWEAISHKAPASLLPGSLITENPLPRKPMVGSKIIRVPLALHRRVASHGSVPATDGAARYTLSSFTVKVNELLCRGCGLCEELCQYKAVQVVYRGEGVFCALVNEDMCRGCGACRSVCPTGAIDQDCFGEKDISRLMDSQRRGKKKGAVDRLVTFICRWASRVSPSGRISGDLIKVMCIGSVMPGEVLKAFEKGASGVLLFGCGEEGCHYGFGRAQAEKNMRSVREILTLLGLDERRVRILDGSTGSLKEAQDSFFSERAKDEHTSSDARI
jgi:NADPH-dependent glutamate synthase beta subunit-like oxidoreductase/coenzyme F420-reducing hydrogenase delta subunit/Pyruvate/2-oxoacid:ferredoxin oxidoreductase delta subunit